MDISKYDVVRVIAEIPLERVDRNTSRGQRPQIGDIGAVVSVRAIKPSQEPSFIVECVGSNDLTVWLAEIFASELDRVASGSGGA
jgi:hypothetical protein